MLYWKYFQSIAIYIIIIIHKLLLFIVLLFIVLLSSNIIKSTKHTQHTIVLEILVGIHENTFLDKISNTLFDLFFLTENIILLILVRILCKQTLSDVNNILL